MHMIHDIYIRSVSRLAAELLQKCIRSNCYGCRTHMLAVESLNGHDVCMDMLWSEQVIKFLPDILRQLTVEDIIPIFRTMYNRIGPKWTAKETKDIPNPFYVDVYICVLLNEMHEDSDRETSIAQAIYGVYKKKVNYMENIHDFGKRYKSIIDDARKTTDSS